MGWDIGHNWYKKSDVIQELIFQYSRSENYQLIAHKSTTNGLWLVMQNKENGKKLIAFDLIKKFGKNLAVKSMDESMGPYYYDCPAKFLDMVPESEALGFNADWRNRWAANKAYRKA